MDGVLQLHILRGTYETVQQPYLLRRLIINVQEHFKNKVLTTDSKTVMVANIIARNHITRCGGVLIEDIQFRKLPVLDEGTTALKTLKFIPHFSSHIDVSKHYFGNVYKSRSEKVTKKVVLY